MSGMLRIQNYPDLLRIVETLRIPEGPSLDYKSTLSVATENERKELLKDLTGIGNGGGGTLVFGVTRDMVNPELPGAIAPLGDPRVVGQIEDIVRNTVKPPLLLAPLTIDCAGGGFVLAIDVHRSPLGPYMIEAYNERRYYVRQGSRTAPMTEQQVRDGYTLAARSREHRSDVWRTHHLPIAVKEDATHLVITGIPEEPLVDLIDPATTPPELLRAPDRLRYWRGNTFVAGLLDELRTWVDGYYAETEGAYLRLHRDGAIGCASQLKDHLRVWMVRLVHADLLHFGWLWDLIGVRTPIELLINVTNLAATSLVLPGWFDEDRPAQVPHGVTGPLALSLRRTVLRRDLLRASARHRLVLEVDTRLRQAFNVPARRAQFFEMGWLLGPDGKSIDLYLSPGGISRRTGDLAASIDSNGLIRHARTSGPIGHAQGGVVLDMGGAAMAAVEAATGTGLPDDFLARDFLDHWRAPGSATGESREPLGASVVPAATKQWSAGSLGELLR
jgi:hypothetical protein